MKKDTKANQSLRMGEANKFNYHLLVISSVINPYELLVQSHLKEYLKSDTKVMLLIHPIEEACKMVKKQNHFFNMVFTHGMRLYVKEDEEMRFINKAVDLKRSKEKRIKQANIWFDRALVLKKMARVVKVDCPCVSEIEVSLLLLGKAIEQAFLGLIYLCLGYYPNNRNLIHLSNLCKLFWHEMNTFLPLKNEYDKMLFKALDKLRSDFPHKETDVKVEEDDLKSLYMKVCHFIEMVETLYFT